MQILEFVKEKESKTPNATIDNISLISVSKKIYSSLHIGTRLMM